MPLSFKAFVFMKKQDYFVRKDLISLFLAVVFVKFHGQKRSVNSLAMSEALSNQAAPDLNPSRKLHRKSFTIMWIKMIWPAAMYKVSFKPSSCESA